ncbi:hypothetical protein J3D55_003952 [Chryseobacterium ginsenosidimutans]|nr:hypothetical protein [Chryseobacterium ginsenosidimutans]
MTKLCVIFSLADSADLADDCVKKISVISKISEKIKKKLLKSEQLLKFISTLQLQLRYLQKS